jgi:hypothetical protein
MPLKLNHVPVKLNYSTRTANMPKLSSDTHNEVHATVKVLQSLSFCNVFSKLVRNYNLFSKVGESNTTERVLACFFVTHTRPRARTHTRTHTHIYIIYIYIS